MLTHSGHARIPTHQIAGTTGAQTGVAAFPPVEDSLRNLVVLNGRIRGFRLGVQMQPVVGSHVRRLTISATAYGIFVGAGADGAGLPNCQSNVTNCIVRNHIEITDPAGSGIATTGDNTHVWGNTVSGTPAYGITTNGDRPRVALNRVEGCGGVGIDVLNYVTYAIVWNNTVVDCTGSESTGIRVAPSGGSSGQPLGRNARVRLNSVTGTFNGISVQDRAALIAQNDSSGNSNNGISVQPQNETEGASNVVRQNNADNNGTYGIYGGIGTIDGGGNTASGPGVQDCTDNLTCAP
jgi:hypothetical protein